MQTINANTDTTIRFDGIDPYDYYLFVFSPSSCDEQKEVLAPDVDCASGIFTFNIDLPMQVYTVDIYGQCDYDNVNTVLATYIRTEQIRVVNPVDMCYNMPYLLDENGYIITDSDGTKILYK